MYKDENGVSFAEVNWEHWYWMSDWTVQEMVKNTPLLSNLDARDTGMLACKYL